MVQKSKREELMCVGSFVKPKREELVFRLMMSIYLFIGEVVGTEGGENACYCCSRGRAGLGPSVV